MTSREEARREIDQHAGVYAEMAAVVDVERVIDYLVLASVSSSLHAIDLRQYRGDPLMRQHVQKMRNDADKAFARVSDTIWPAIRAARAEAQR